MAFPTCRVCRFQTRLSAPTRWLRPQIESSKGKNWLPVTSYDKYSPLLPWSVAVYSIYLFIYLFRNRVPSVPRSRRGSCSVLADRAFWASLRTARIWVYSALIIKCTPPQKENRLGGKVLTSASVVGLSSRPVAQEIFHLHVDGWPRARVHAWCPRTEPTHAQT